MLTLPLMQVSTRDYIRAQCQQLMSPMYQGGLETTHPPIPSSTGSSTATHSSHSSSHVGVIAGSTVGGCLGLALISALLSFLYRRRPSRMSRNNSRLNAADGPGVLATPQSSTWELGLPASQPQSQKVYVSNFVVVDLSLSLKV